MKKFIALIIAAAAVFVTSPQQAQAQAINDVLLIQRTGTTTVNLPALGAGAHYIVLRSGSTTLTSGSGTVTDAQVTAASIFSFTGIGNTAAGSLNVGTINSGTNFQILSTSGSDGRVVYWWFLKP